MELVAEASPGKSGQAAGERVADRLPRGEFDTADSSAHAIKGDAAVGTSVSARDTSASGNTTHDVDVATRGCDGKG